MCTPQDIILDWLEPLNFLLQQGECTSRLHPHQQMIRQTPDLHQIPHLLQSFLLLMNSKGPLITLNCSLYFIHFISIAIEVIDEKHVDTTQVEINNITKAPLQTNIYIILPHNSHPCLIPNRVQDYIVSDVNSKHSWWKSKTMLVQLSMVDMKSVLIEEGKGEDRVRSSRHYF